MPDPENRLQVVFRDAARAEIAYRTPHNIAPALAAIHDAIPQPSQLPTRMTFFMASPDAIGMNAHLNAAAKRDELAKEPTSFRDELVAEGRLDPIQKPQEHGPVRRALTSLARRIPRRA